MKDRIIPDGFLLEDNGKILETGPMAAAPAALHSAIPAAVSSAMQSAAPEALQNGVCAHIDCKGLYLSPGFIDIHTHGGGNTDYLDGSETAFINSARAHLRHGTTSLLPTASCCADETLFRFIDNFKAVKKTAANIPCMPGLHLEGPYFSIEQRGAQETEYIKKPDPRHYEKILEYGEGCILRWSAAPELEGALEMGRRLSAQGILMSIGHSSATYDEVLAAVDNGYSHVTHLYSGMSTITRRSGFRILGVIESTYIIDSLTVEIIADGLHLPPELLKHILRGIDNNRICLITDSIRAAGGSTDPEFPDNKKHRFIIEDGIAKLPDRSAFAGSIATADRLIRVMTQKAGLPLEKAAGMLTRIPAAVTGLKKKGSLQAGYDADFILFDENIEIKKIFVGGKEMSV